MEGVQSKTVLWRMEFWYEFASTYSYPAAMRIDRLAHQAGVRLDWCPFLLGPLFNQQSGWNDSPFNIYPVKGRYMWRDMERLCKAEGLAFSKPKLFPQNGLLAARVAVVGRSEGWVSEFSKRIYRANFAEGLDISKESIVAQSLQELGLNAAEILEAARSEETKSRLKAQTELAESKGLFGAPSFVVGKELFWGNDRLEQAVAWAAEGLQ